MKSFILFVAIVCGGASFLFFTAAKEASNASWATQVCRDAGWFCHNPQLLAFAAVGTIWSVGSCDACDGCPRLATTHDNEDEAPHCIAAVDFCCSSSSICAASSRSASAAVPCGEHKKVWLGSVVWCPGGQWPPTDESSPEIAAGEVAHL